MSNENACKIEYLTVISDRKRAEELLEALRCADCHLIHSEYAKGSVTTGYFRDMLGLMPEEKKVVITCLVASTVSGTVLKLLEKDFDFDKPNTGIAFTVPVETVSL